VEDAGALRALRPHDVAAYLRTRGWSVEGTFGAFTRYARGSNGGREQIEVPRASEYEDYHLRMGEVLRALSRLEKRSQLELLEDLSLAGTDVVRMRLSGVDFVDGSVPLEDGALLVERVRDVMLASACAAVQPRAYFGTRKPAEATEYVRKVRLGQTEVGSFVVKVLSPVPPLLSPLEAGNFFPEDLPLPFERRVTEMLLGASRAATNAAVEAGATGTLGPFEQAVAAGVSANLCEGLASMLVDRPYSALELSVGWARSRPAPAGSERVVRVTRETAQLMVSAAQQFKARAPREGFELEGYVVALDNENVGTHGGVITIAAEVDAGTRRVRVVLDAGDYKKALDAHGKMARVGCSGRLVKAGRQYELKDSRDFVLLGDE
jgi:hypothetical protein